MAERSNAEGRSTSSSTDTTSTASATFWRLWKAFASDRGELGQLVCEFLEVCIHQLLCIRELYPSELFERRRHFSVPVQWARHPGLREYIHSAVTLGFSKGSWTKLLFWL